MSLHSARWLLWPLLAGWLVGCAPEVGSEAWCKNMKAKNAGDWTTNEAADFAKHCIFK